MVIFGKKQISILSAQLADREIEIEHLKDEIARLSAITSEPASKPARKRRKKKTVSLAARAKMSKAWTPARSAQHSRAMKDFWALERATKPAVSISNGNGAITTTIYPRGGKFAVPALNGKWKGLNQCRATTTKLASLTAINRLKRFLLLTITLHVSGIPDA
jgi:hypothetical protein